MIDFFLNSSGFDAFRFLILIRNEFRIRIEEKFDIIYSINFELFFRFRCCSPSLFRFNALHYRLSRVLRGLRARGNFEMDKAAYFQLYIRTNTQASLSATGPNLTDIVIE